MPARGPDLEEKFMIRTLYIALPIALLASCKEQAPSIDAENKERAEAAAQRADPNALMPGKWETKQDIQAVHKAGLNAESKEDIRRTEASIDQCLPPEEAKRPDANFFAGGDESECEYTKFAMQGGKLNATMSCTATPGTITMTLNGTYTPTSYLLDATATTSGIPDAPMRTTAKLVGTWLSACPDEAAQRAPEDPAR
jgi:Protein of unknown function (DUF3617)